MVPYGNFFKLKALGKIMSKGVIKLKNGSTIAVDTDLPEEEKLKTCSTKLLKIWY